MRREILIDGIATETRVALLEDGVVAEIVVERTASRVLAGNIYKGRVSSVLPGMQAAFVDIGTGRDAFLYVEDLRPGPVDEEPRDAPDEASADPGAPPGEPERRIEELVQEGQELVVQITKDPVPEKGARLSAQVSLPGRHLVYLPGVAHVGVSRRIEPPEERERLRQLAGEVLAELSLPGGFIVRTAGKGSGREELLADARLHAATWAGIERLAGGAATPSLLHQEAGMVEKLLRDVLGEDVERVLVEGEAALRRTLDIVGRIAPALADRVRAHEGERSLFDERGVQTQIERALRPRVWLKSGGSIVIHPTEALVAIDVNTGKFVGGRRLEETILKTNLEAAVEIVRQIRLRDLGGIIVADFIDMTEPASKEEVLRVLQAEILKDRSKTRLLPINEFGLVEITRQRTRPSLERQLCRPCPLCSGSGRLKTFETIALDVMRAVRRLAPLERGARIVAAVHPDTAAFVLGDGAAVLGRDDAGASPEVEFVADPALRPDQFQLTVTIPD